MIMDDRDEAHAHDRIDDAAHSATADKLKGRAKQVIGSTKEKIGEVIGDRELEGKGEAQRLDGKKDQAKGDIKEAVENVKDHVKGGAEYVKEKLDKARDR